eukprot:1180781-Prymnesium_polylepis.2
MHTQCRAAPAARSEHSAARARHDTCPPSHSCSCAHAVLPPPAAACPARSGVDTRGGAISDRSTALATVMACCP